MKKLRSRSSCFSFIFSTLFAKPLFIEIGLFLIHAFHVKPLNFAMLVITLDHFPKCPALASAVERL
jgi:hypothetical protein